MSNDKIVKESDIIIRIGLDAENIPARIDWFAEDSPDTPVFTECKAMLLSLFDKGSLDTMKIDLWTQEMQVAEMDKFMYQTLRALADTYFRSTNNRELAIDMQRFVQFFGEKTEVLPKTSL